MYFYPFLNLNILKIEVLMLPVISMGSRAKVSSSLCARLVCSAWSVIAGRGSVGPESGLSGAPASDAQQQLH